MSRKSFAYKPKKSLGQNFIINPGICPKMAEAAGIDTAFGVLEIGPGLGALSKEIAKRAARVVAVELDRGMIPALKANMAEYANFEVVEGDVLKLDLNRLVAEKFDGLRVAVMGNLPYYITSPILMKLLEERLPAESITVMVQREAAKRFCAETGTREAGAVTYAIRYYSHPKLLFDVAPGSFHPPPKVTSTVMRLDIACRPTVEAEDAQWMFKVIRGGFEQRRKTAANALSAALDIEKGKIIQALEKCGLDSAIRPERITLHDYASISDILLKMQR